MADLKISQLTGATTPLAGTEVVPLVQSSTTKKVAVSDLTAGRTVNAAALGVGVTTPASGTTIEARNAAAGTAIRASNSGGGYVEIVCESNATSNAQLNYTNQITASGGDFKLSSANFVPTTAAKGINFTANTPAAGMTSQLLNWYEEGTWTVTLTPGTSGTIGLYSTFDECQYTRIGRMMFVSGQIKIISTSSPVGTYVRMSLPSFVADLPEIAGRMGSTVSKSNVVYAALAVEGANYIDIQTSAAGFAVDEIVAFSFAYVTA